jgi:hypothetical protein
MFHWVYQEARQISLHVAQWHVSKTLFLSIKARLLNFLFQLTLRDGFLLARELPLGRMTINSRDFYTSASFLLTRGDWKNSFLMWKGIFGKRRKE